ncbi:MAG: hypothetical protein PHG97_01770 [Candidatus Margulisbacteria bacterium]|nr:hypothetical protein [Candidatus Margulisiibacteriota bacterium]
MAITNKDVEKLKEVFATKEDLKSFATKEDLKSFATKEDLKAFATKEGLKVFATKDELTTSINGLRTELIEKIDDSAKEVKREILGGLDKVMGELAKIRDEQTCARGKDREQDHRLDKLEAKVGV